MLWTALLFCFLGQDANAVERSWQYPLAVAAADDRIVVADRLLPGLWHVKGDRLSVLFEGSKKFKTPLNAVRCVTIGPDGVVYAGCSSTRQVFRIDESGPVPLAGPVGKDGGIGVGIPMDIAVTEDGLYVSDLELHRIVKLPLEGGRPVDVAAVRAPRGLFWTGEELLVISHGENAVVSVRGEDSVEVVVSGQPFEFAHDLVRLDGSLYVTDGYADAIVRVDADGAIAERFQANGMTNPVGVTLSAGESPQVIVIDPQAKSLFRLSDEGLARFGPVVSPVATETETPAGSPAQAPTATADEQP